MNSIHVWGVRQNNLKNIDVQIPLHKMTVMCGPSGSGKSSLAFDTLFAEGQRRYIESMSNYTKQFLNKAPKPDIDGIENIPPAIALEQKNSVRNGRSTVGTVTEISDYLRLLYEKLATPFCPTHQQALVQYGSVSAAEAIVSRYNQVKCFLCIEVDDKQRKLNGKKLHAELVKSGFLRILVESNSGNYVVEDLNEPKWRKSGVPKTTFYLVIDRLVVSPEDLGRLMDSCSAANAAYSQFSTGPRRLFLILQTGEKIKFSENLECPFCDYASPPMNSALFNFNSPLGACSVCKGFGSVFALDEGKIVPNPKLTLNQGAIAPLNVPSASDERKFMKRFCAINKISMDVPWEDLAPEDRQDVWNGGDSFDGVKGFFEYLETKTYKMHVRIFLSRFRSYKKCDACKGTRLNPAVSSILFRGLSITQVHEQKIEELSHFYENLQLNAAELGVASEIIFQIRSRLKFLMEVGLTYISLGRETRTLSGGEFQRVALSKQLGLGLSQALFVLDEPTIGLHPRDSDKLIGVLKKLVDVENTVVVVEHDKDVICHADHIVELGPQSGYLGGEIVFAGSTNEFLRDEKSLTSFWLKHRLNNWLNNIFTRRPVDLSEYKFLLQLKGAKGNNLKHIDLKLPLNRFVVVTGVSGSGKSTLVSQTLYPAIARKLNAEYLSAQEFAALEGADFLKSVVLVDQSTIGRTLRSNPVTYMECFDGIRNVMSMQMESKARGYSSGFFSLMVDGGRCPICNGLGFEEVDMMFMDNLQIPCDECDGKLYRKEALEVLYKGKNIFEILNLTVNQALEFFVDVPKVRRSLLYLSEVGLDYIKLGQSSSTLSGGESQRLKIAKELSQSHHKATLYILDEPTTGLHFKEVAQLIGVLQKMVENGATVLVVEHNLDMIWAADWVIDLGPEAGDKGGEIVAEGTPEDILKISKSHTGRFLAEMRER